MKPIILLQTDFSNTWGAVASMKGIIRKFDREVDIQDLCHEIRKFDPWEASLSLNTVERCWPEGTIIVSVVDPGVGTDRKACAALLKDGTIVITPDNGTLTHLKNGVGIQQVRQIDESINRYKDAENVNVFDGRDVFAYTAVRLSSGAIDFEGVGPAYDVKDIVECEEYHMDPVLEEGHASGYLMTGLVHFGGVQFNIRNEDFEKICGFALLDQVHITIAHEGKPVFDQVVPFAKSFGFVPEGAPVLYRGSSQFVSLDCNCASFMETYGVDFGKKWTVDLRRA